MRRAVKIVVLSAVVLGAGLAIAGAAVTDDTPRFLYASLLNGLEFDSRTGDLQLATIQVALPSPPGGGRYAPEGPGKVWAVIATGAGAQVARFDFYAEKGEGAMWVISSYTLTRLEGGAAQGSRLRLAPGDYVLESHLPTGCFYTFPFTVSLAQGGGKNYYFLDGDWGSWAYLLYAGADPEEALIWKVWLRNKAPQDSKTVRTRVEVVRDADRALVCTSREGESQDLTPRWNRFAFDLIHPMQGTGGGAYFKAVDLLRKDGSYTLKMSLDGQPYGTWKFAVAGGKLSRTGRADRAQADPLTFIEGSRDAWWFGGQTTAGQAQVAVEAKPEPSLSMIPDANPIVVKGTALLAAKSILNWLAATVTVGGQKVTAVLGDHRLEMTVGSPNAIVDGKTVTAPVEAVERNGDLYVPIRFSCEALGAQVKWDAGTKTMTINIGDRFGRVKVP